MGTYLPVPAVEVSSEVKRMGSRGPLQPFNGPILLHLGPKLLVGQGKLLQASLHLVKSRQEVFKIPVPSSNFSFVWLEVGVSFQQNI